MLLATTLVLAMPKDIGSTGSSGASFHPLEPGATWEYDVVERGKQKHQTVDLKAGHDGRYVLTTRTGLRRVRYTISRDSLYFRLHHVRYKLSFLPFFRTTRFEPPLPYLPAGPIDTLSWSWRGRASGMDRSLRDADYVARVVDGELVVEAEYREGDGTTHGQRAVYRQGVGLVSVEGPEYWKQLVGWERVRER